MEKFVKGDVVVVPFPFSDLTEAKRRPALVLAELDKDDRILCQITSQQFRELNASRAVPLSLGHRIVPVGNASHILVGCLLSCL